MAGPHFFIDPAAVDGSSAVLEGDDAHHLATVLRARVGEPVSLADGTGAVYDALVAHVDRGRVSLDVTARRVVPPPVPRLTVVHALPKARKLDEVIQRLTEVGVDRIVPAHSARSEVRLSADRALTAVTRWRAVALAAAKQSRRARLPEVSDVGEWQTAFAGVAAGVVLWEEATTPLSEVLGSVPAAEELILGIGPEGGLTPEEVAATGLPAASLGPTILRTETAALVAASAALYALGRLG